MRTVLIGLFSVFLIAGVEARPLTQAEQMSLDMTRDRFLVAFQTDDYETILSVVPPRILEHIAGTIGVSVEALRGKMLETFEAGLGDIEFVDLRMDTAGLDASDVTEDGKVYVWGFAPTYMEMNVSGQNMKVNNQTVVLLDNGTWYLIRTSDIQQITILRTVYPFFNKVDFPAAGHPAVAE